MKHPEPTPSDEAPKAEQQLNATPAIPQPGPTAPLIKGNSTANQRIRRRNQPDSGCWAQGGTLDCNKATDWALTDLAQESGIETNPITTEVEKIRAYRVGDETKIYIKPTHSTDIDGIKLKRTNGSLTINMYSFLAQEHLLLPLGKRQQFDLPKVPAGESPVGAALVLDFSRALETKLIPARKKANASAKKANTKQQSAKPATPDPGAQGAPTPET